MAEIRPFKGLLYNKRKIGDYSKVVAPPYDVIPENMRDKLYEKDENNIIRLILGKSFDSDNQRENKYTRAKKFLNEWLKEKIFVKDDAESFYLYAQEYDHKGKKCKRLGFMGLMRIGEKGEDAVLPHENTLSKPKEDRMNLIKQVESNLSPIFTLYDDKENVIRGALEKKTSESAPVIDITVDGVRHKLWKFREEDALKKIIKRMNGKNVFIADGHHRYEVARMYRDMCRKKNGYNGNADYVMMYFTDMADENDLTVMATHRVIKMMPSEDDKELISRLSEYFIITDCKDLFHLMKGLEEESDKGYAFGFLINGRYFLLKPKEKEALLGLIREEKPKEWKELDVSILHSAIFKRILSVSDAEGNITYVRDAENAEALIKDGSHMAAFLLNPTRVEQLKAVAELGEMMPQKSTYFYPKLLTGLVMNKFN